VANKETDLLISQLDQPVGATKNEQLIEGFLFPNQESKGETLLLAGLSLCDFIFDLSAIDSKVLEAADFSHTADLGDPFLFAEFAERITSLSTAAIKGHEANLLGYPRHLYPPLNSPSVCINLSTISIVCADTPLIFNKTLPAAN
jgi:hypothetical protein